jgi:hypothetical protein
MAVSAFLEVNSVRCTNEGRDKWFYFPSSIDGSMGQSFGFVKRTVFSVFGPLEQIHIYYRGSG